MKDTVFTPFHVELNAKMASFAGYNMPIEYTGINEEHLTVRQKAGIFDVSHMGEVWVKGTRALAFIQYITTNDASVLTAGKVQYSCFPNGQGGIVDDLLVYCIDAETYLLVINAANIQKDWEFMCRIAPRFGLTPGKELYNASDEICQLAVQGPMAMKIMQKICDRPIENMPYYTFQKLTIAGISDVIFATTGYTGAGGCEIYAANADGEKLWKAVCEAGAEFGLKPIGLGARDTLRLEMGFCLYGNDIDDSTSPIEAGLGWITKFNDAKGDFLDRARLWKQKNEGVTRNLVSFEMIDKGVPRHGYELTDASGVAVGVVTSGTMSPCLKTGIGMGYIKTEYAHPNNEIFVNIRNRQLKAKVVKPPFIK
ncbi:MAG: glycine cleavage system aminomethyltransferase GcvT [Prevotellaceae bacterium]|jgi:aminomethyltransferase|nr:glycine cleavage system aminomethyltransferase GcvT [Prevotellaceae bacterium]